MDRLVSVFAHGPHRFKVPRLAVPEPAYGQPRYRPDIDGLRAIAVGLVVLDHAGLMFPGGFIGVDVFFVISGFLITRLILADIEAGTMTLKGFWMRRVRRILPAALATVGVTLLVGALLLPPDVLTQLAESAVAQQAGLANMYFWKNCGYFDLPSGVQPLLHTWSLAVEEQFYLLWPLVLILLCRRSRRALVFTVSMLLLASLALSEVVVRSHPPAAFYLMPTRMWELLLGAVLVWCPPRPARALGHSVFLGFIGLLLIVLTAWTYAPTTQFPGLSALPPCLGAALIIATPTWRRFSVSALLSMRFGVYIGRASYSIYLWHWPLMVFARIIGEDVSLASRASVALASLAIGSLSFQFIETPFRARRLAPDSKRFLLYAGLVVLFICSTSSAMISYFGSSSREASRHDDRPSRHDLSWLSSRRPESLYSGLLGEPTMFSPSPAFAIWGDSHAKVITPLCDSLARSRQLGGVCFARPGFAPLVGVWCDLPTSAVKEVQLQWGDDVMKWIKANHVRNVIMAARWDSKVPPPAKEVTRRYIGLIRDRASGTSQVEGRSVWEQAFSRTVSRLESSGIRVWFVMQVPVQETDVFGRPTGHPTRGVSEPVYHRQQLEIDRVLSAFPSPMLTVIGPGSHWFDRHGNSVTADNGGSLYRDGDHLNEYGARKLFQPLLEPMFDEMARDALSSPARVGASATEAHGQ